MDVGYSNYGQLGLNDKISRSSPVQVPEQHGQCGHGCRKNICI